MFGIMESPVIPSVPPKAPGCLHPGRILSAWADRKPSVGYPPMKKETTLFLEKLYARENRDLGELLGLDLSAFWPYMSK